MNVLKAASLEPQTEDMTIAKKKAIAQYKDGVPISVIASCTGLTEAQLNAFLEEVELSKEELQVRDSMLATYYKSAQSMAIQRRTQRIDTICTILDKVNSDFSELMVKGMRKIKEFVDECDPSTYKELANLLSVLKGANELNASMHKALSDNDVELLKQLLKDIEIEQTDTTRQIVMQTEVDASGNVILDEEGKRKEVPVVEENSVRRKIVVGNPKKP